MNPGGSESSTGDSDDSGAGRGNANDESREGRAGMATGAIGSSDASRGNEADVGDICTDFRRKNVEMGVVACMWASCGHVSLPHLDNLLLGEDRSPRVARELGEGRGEVDGTFVDLLVSNNVGRLPFRGIEVTA